MDSKLKRIITQSDDECNNQHHEIECTHFEITQINNITLEDNTSTNSKYTTLNNLDDDQQSTQKNDAADSENSTENEEESSITSCNELKTMIKLAIPVSITSISRLFMVSTDQIFLGHLGTKQVAGASLANTCRWILALFVFTPAGSLNALCSQALGSGNRIMMGYWLQLTIIICTLMCVPVSIAYFYVSDLIGATSNDAQVIEYSKEFAKYAVSFLWTSVMLLAIRSYHQSLEVVRPFTIISVISILLNMAGNELWIYGLDINIGRWKIKFNGLGFIGSPLATSTSMFLQLLMYYVWCFKIKKYYIKHETWNGWSLKKTIFSKKRVKEYAKVIIPMMISDASETWGYLVVILYAARLDAAQIATLFSTFSVWGILGSFYSGIGSAIITRFGKRIGSGNIEAAKLVAKMGLLLSVSTCMSTAVVIYTLRNELAMVYSNDKEVIHLMHQTIKLLCLQWALAGNGWSARNLLEAMGKNKANGIINSVTAWFGYVPASLYFMTGDNHKLLGISAVSCFFVVSIAVEILRAIALWIMVFCVDWKKACIEAQQRNNAYEDEAGDEDGDEIQENENNDKEKEVYISMDKLEIERDKSKNEDKIDKVDDVQDALKRGLLDSSQAEVA